MHRLYQVTTTPKLKTQMSMLSPRVAARSPSLHKQRRCPVRLDQPALPGNAEALAPVHALPASSIHWAPLTLSNYGCSAGPSVKFWPVVVRPSKNGRPSGPYYPPLARRSATNLRAANALIVHSV